MGKKVKGFWDSEGRRLKRDQPVCTRTGIILYKGTGKQWIINYPDGTQQFGGVDTIKLINLIYHLGHGKNLDESRELSGLSY